MASLVVKVKYEETLRRFNVAINGDGRLDLSMEGLRLKICSLFSLPSDSQFRLTYKDEDDDLVALVDDDDLYDVVRQGLDPVRITVHLISDQKPQSSSARSSGSSLNHNGIKTVNSDLERVTVRFVKEPQTEATKSCESSIVGVSHQNANLSNSSVGNDTKCSCSDGREPEGVKPAGIEKRSQVPGGSLSVNGAAAPKNLNKTDNMTIVHTDIACDGCGLHPICGPRFKSKVMYDYDLCRGCFLHVGNEIDYCRIDLPVCYKSPERLVSDFDADNIGSISHKGITCDGCGVAPIFGPRFKSKVKYNYDLCNICFSQIAEISKDIPLDYARIDVPLTYHHLEAAPYVDHWGVIIHNGVFCNGCGVLPICGLRFKSKVRYDFDLCSICFTAGNDNKDYIRIATIDSDPDVKSPCQYTPVQWEYPILKLDSCFIKHVSIPNGTVLAPLTPFTKIWRMRNNGTLPWFNGLRLIWVGGDRLSTFDSVEIQVPAFGLECGQELNIAVGFIAPELPGQYTCFWRMVSGQMFGQQVSVQIQVDPSADLIHEAFRKMKLNFPPNSSKTVFPEVANVKAEPRLDIEATNSNAAPSVVNQNRKIQMFDLNLDIRDDLPPAANSNSHGSPVGPSTLNPLLFNIPEASTPILSYPTSDNHGELLPSSVSYPETDASSDSIPEAFTHVQSDPTNDSYGEFLAAGLDAGNLDNNGTLDKNINLEQVNDNTETEEKLLKELEQIGFKQIDLDSEVDSEGSVDDLSDDSDWDPILEELVEMGFEDKD